MDTAEDNVAITDLLVEDITPEAIDPSICLRIIRTWETPSFSNPLLPQTLEIIFIDQENKRIQGTVRKELVPEFRDKLWEGATLLLEDFMVEKNQSIFKYAEHEYKIVFLPATTVKDIDIDTPTGSTYGFDFVSFEDILKNNLQDNQIIDIIGAVVNVGNIITGEYNGKPNRRRIIRLEDLNGRTIDCTLWDAILDEFGDLIQQQNSDDHVFMIMQFGKSKEYRRSCSVGSALFGTRLFINTDIPQLSEFKKKFLANAAKHEAKLKVGSISMQPVIADPGSFFEDCKPISLKEIPKLYKDTQCVTVATITSICKDKPWFYLACRKCTCTVKPNDNNASSSTGVNNKWNCRQCGPNVTAVIPRYKVQVRVVNEMGSAMFLLFERDIKKLFHTSAYQLRGNMTGDPGEFPDELDDIVGKKCAFVFKVTDWNYEKGNRVYGVSKLSKDEAVMKAFFKKHGCDENLVTPDEDDDTIIKNLSTETIKSGDKRNIIDVEAATDGKLASSVPRRTKVKIEKN